MSYNVDPHGAPPDWCKRSIGTPFTSPQMPTLTKREYFILEMAKANRIGSMELPADKMADWAVADADALLAKLAEVKS